MKKQNFSQSFLKTINKVTGVVILTVAATAAHAGSVNFDFRFDSDSTTYNDAAKAASASNVSSTNMKMKAGRVDFKGKASEELAYRLRWRFDKDYTNPKTSATVVNTKTDGFTNHVDYAYVSHKLMNDFTVTLGKFGSELGGFEGNTAAPDIYLYSQFYNQILPSFIYVTGGKLTYNLGQHELSLLALNQSEATTTEQSKMSLGLTYKGQFMENKELTVLASYLNDEKQSVVSDAKKTIGVTSLGVKFDPKPYYISVDYLVFDQKNKSAKDDKDNWNSIVADFGYDIDGIIPKLKYEMSQYKTETASVASATTKYDGITLGVEFKPIRQENFRYHMMVTQLTTKPATGDSQFEQHFLIGTKITADFLK